jgi:protein-disulfide isomerase
MNNEARPKKQGMLSSVSAPLAFIFGIVTTVAICSFVGLVIMLVIFLSGDTTGTTKTNTNTSAAVTNTNTAPAAQSSIDPDSIRYTVGSGKLTFVEYTDLECPYCKTFHPTIDSLKSTYDGKIAFTTKHFPLNIHPKAERENGAAECAGNQGKFFEFIDKIFEVTPSNNKLEDEVLFTTAEDLGLDMDKFRSCVENKDYATVQTADATEAEAVGATGTPFSILIDEDGKILTRFKGVVSAAQLSSAFDQFLAQQ